MKRNSVTVGQGQKTILSFFSPPPKSKPQQGAAPSQGVQESTPTKKRPLSSLATQPETTPTSSAPPEEKRQKQMDGKEEAAASVVTADEPMNEDVAKLLEGVTGEMFDFDQEETGGGAKAAARTAAGAQRRKGRAHGGGEEDEEDEGDKALAASRKFTDGFFNTAKRKEIHRSVTHEEVKYPFLKDVMDSKKRRPGEPGYDPSTLFIPSAAYTKLTSFDKQFWDIKREHFDTVVFFRKGKFYELYENDAEIGQRELGLHLSGRQGMKMVGVPAPSLMDWSAKLLSKGYKVARVDEMERADAGGILRRELTRIFTPGTLTEESLIGGPAAVYLLSFTECESEDGRATYGVCLSDAASGEFLVGEFSDDKHRTAFETLLVQKRPREILVVADKSPDAPSQTSLALIRSVLPSRCDVLKRRPGDQFWDASRTAQALESSKYFGDPLPGNSHWPAALLEICGKRLALSAFGGCLQYLQEIKLDGQLLSLKNVRAYGPTERTENLVLDGQTLRNLEILRNSAGGYEGTLLATIDHTHTAFGKRMFTRWLCCPLFDAERIDERLDAVDDINSGESAEAVETLRAVLHELPDLERRVARINATAAAAVLPAVFVEVICAFDRWAKALSGSIAPGLGRSKSRLLSSLVALKEAGGVHPDIGELVAGLGRRMDLEASAAAKEIRPIRGKDERYDAHFAAIEAIRRRQREFLQEAQRALRCDKVQWAEAQGTGEDGGGDDEEIRPAKKQLKMSKKKKEAGFKADKRLLLQVPTKAVSDRIPADWVVVGKPTKQWTCYWTPLAEEIAPVIADEEEAIRQQEQQLARGLVEQFCQSSAEWAQAISCIAQLDCLQCLAAASQLLDSPSCRPKFLRGVAPFLELTEMRHPCICGKIENFVPNSCKLSARMAPGEVPQPPVMLLTGPNMGGKSTLLRQTCVCVIMAQLGCYVPAESCTLTPVDRIFTRIGASDNIVAGQSTFMVELQETSSVLTHATPSSLVVLDELGRGTATYDGYAIAYAVLRHVAESVCCRTLFSTHYHMLTREFEGRADIVSLKYLDCTVLPETQEIIFTYRLRDGLCPQSYGLNVASGAGLPPEVIRRAKEIAEAFAQESGLARREQFLASASMARKIATSLRGEKPSADSLRVLWKSIAPPPAAMHPPSQVREK